MHLSQLKSQLVLLVISCVVLVVVHAPILTCLPEMIARDTILTLTPVARLLLVGLALVASFVTALFCLGKTRYLQRAIQQSKRRSVHGSTTLAWVVGASLDLLVTAGMLWAATGVAPQLFYTLYQIVIPGLPVQWVGTVISLPQWLELLKLESVDSLSALSSGFLMLVVMLTTLLSWACQMGRVLQDSP